MQTVSGSVVIPKEPGAPSALPPALAAMQTQGASAPTGEPDESEEFVGGDSDSGGILPPGAFAPVPKTAAVDASPPATESPLERQGFEGGEEEAYSVSSFRKALAHLAKQMAELKKEGDVLDSPRVAANDMGAPTESGRDRSGTTLNLKQKHKNHI